jgi:UrcA family protein
MNMTAILAPSLVLSLALLAPLTATQAATPAVAVATERVLVPGSELNSATGRASAESRIRAAARHVCQDSHETGVAGRARQEQCYARAVDDGLRQLDSLTAYAAASDTRGHGG